jgi:hypothetical protein
LPIFRSPKSSFPTSSPPETVYTFCHLSCACYMPWPSHLPWCDQLVTFNEKYKLLSSIMHFF